MLPHRISDWIDTRTCSSDETLGSHVSPAAPCQVPSSDRQTLPQL
eukprot:COSAG01_NODE_9771_length_2349_cov_0.980000_1_plen_44_part_10